MLERNPEKRLETWSIEDRSKLVKALSKNEVWASFALFLRAQCDRDVAQYKPDCECQCNCKKCGRIGPKEEKVLKICEELQGIQEENGFTIQNLFKLLNENGHFDAMKTLKKYVPEKEYEKAFSHMPEGIDVEQLKIPNIPYKELEEGCKEFSESLGSGAFGEVFKGKWREQPIAAKKIKDPSFFVELKVSHLYGAAENILQLLAYSFNQTEGNISYLIYPYMENGSVFRRLRNGRPKLNWFQRANIAWGTARGLAYLHSQDISHGDIKSSNILLDKHFEPRIADCGLAMGLDQSKTSTLVDKARGTHVYMPPEFKSDLKLSAKVDVFSYGIFLFELISGVSPIQRDDGQAFEDMKCKMMEANMDVRNPEPPLIDRRIPIGSTLHWPKFLFICGKLCVPIDYHERPTMKKISEYHVWKYLNQPTNQQVIDIGFSSEASTSERARANLALKRREEFLKQNLLPKAQYVYDKENDTYRKPITADVPPGLNGMPPEMMFIPENFNVIGNRLISEFGEMVFM